MKRFTSDYSYNIKYSSLDRAVLKREGISGKIEFQIISVRRLKIISFFKTW